MATEDKKRGMLTSSLDFEGVEGYGNDLDDWLQSDLPMGSLIDKNAPPKAKVAPPPPEAPAEPPLPPPPPKAKAPAAPVAPKPKAKTTTAPSTTATATKTATAKPKVPPPEPVPAKKKVSFRDNENFSFYVGVAVILGLLMMFWVAYAYVQKAPGNLSGLTYVVLPEATFNLKGKVFRMQVTVQAKEQDEVWLQDNKKQLNDAFNLAISKMDPDEMASPKGYEKIQNDLKVEMNKFIPGNHIQAVLLAQLLMQNAEE